jgi:hypothetical protein
MRYDRKTRKNGSDRVKEPVQVYLDPEDQDRLERLREQLDSSKSDVLRRGLEALEREITDPDRHPALRIIGIARHRATGSDTATDPGYDVVREHDRFLTESEEESWEEEGDREKEGKRGHRGA